MKLKKLLVCLSTVALLAGGITSTAMAAEPVSNPSISASATAIGGGTAQPCSDVIETHFRTTADGRFQYRRWNATHGYWVDPYWIDLP